MGESHFDVQQSNGNGTSVDVYKIPQQNFIVPKSDT
jgi:hypothetical protein